MRKQLHIILTLIFGITSSVEVKNSSEIPADFVNKRTIQPPLNQTSLLSSMTKHTQGRILEQIFFRIQIRVVNEQNSQPHCSTMVA